MNVIKSIRFFVEDHLRYAKRTRGEFVVYSFLQLLMFLTLYYGLFQILPEVCADCSLPVFVLHYVWGLWLFFAIESNLYLIRRRSSSIAGRMLIPPKQDGEGDGPPAHTPGWQEEGHRDNVTNATRHMAEHFTPRPYNSDSAWHICGTCEVFVPPRAWHCNTCQTCILRRDHHCVFAMQCIGEENHANFIGLLFYLSSATLYCSILGYIRTVHMQGMEWYWWLFKCIVALYTVFIDQSLFNIIMSVNFTGCMAVTGIFLFYVMLGLRGQTSADFSRKISRQTAGSLKYSIKNLQSLVGSNPFYKILWPFHRVNQNQYDSGGSMGSAKDL